MGVLRRAPEPTPIFANPSGKLLQKLGSLMELHEQPGFIDQNDGIGLDDIGAASLTHFGPQEFGDDKESNRFERLIELADIEINIAIVQRKTRPGWKEMQIAFEALAQS